MPGGFLLVAPLATLFVLRLLFLALFALSLCLQQTKLGGLSGSPIFVLAPGRVRGGWRLHTIDYLGYAHFHNRDPVEKCSLWLSSFSSGASMWADIEHSARALRHRSTPLRKLDPVIRLIERNSLGRISNVAQESPNSDRFSWLRTAKTGIFRCALVSTRGLKKLTPGSRKNSDPFSQKRLRDRPNRGFRDSKRRTLSDTDCFCRQTTELGSWALAPMNSASTCFLLMGDGGSFGRGFGRALTSVEAWQLLKASGESEFGT